MRRVMSSTTWRESAFVFLGRQVTSVFPLVHGRPFVETSFHSDDWAIYESWFVDEDGLAGPYYEEVRER